MVAVKDLNERSREILRRVVETYLETGDPVGSRFLSRHLPISLSAASIRNVMSDLEALGLIFSPHTSAGRVPTEAGLRMFVDGLLEIGDLSEDERSQIERQVSGQHKSVEDVLDEASKMLSGLSHAAGFVVAPKFEASLKHIEFVAMDPGRALVVIVTEGGEVENRVIEVPMGLTPSALTEATNYLNARLRGKTFEEAKAILAREVETQKAELNELTSRVVASGLATWSGAKPASNSDDPLSKSLIVRGRSRLLNDVHAMEDLERVRLLFDDLENKSDLVQLLGLAEKADGVRIFIGSENKLFSMSGSSLVISPYMDSRQHVVGVLGVIGPTRLNYARIIPMVDYTAKLVGRLIN
ncbi:MAG: heat-inducible transcriptional repressor HrcA [Parvibaculum sp.]|uniref:heat-inducible transcriptional repressor HrcA n=1 Tax=Parvibaculum sp. TaxID=2024848 RepID=UPI0025D4C3EF|nr:heat-inducible transcriptional repressor HrcA [Parvibaculum sp.]MCE9648122.1 heat-inducible transcriptional repressor HrcA [Parvibaculum sp.]